MLRGFAHFVVVGFLFVICGSAAQAVPGACCLDGGTCFTGTVEDCAAAFPTPGAYQGDGSTCATSLCGQQGACCFPDGTCQDLFWGPCDSSTGTFQGDGSSCTPNVCPPPAPVPTQINHQGVVSVNGQRYTGNGQFYFAIIDPATGNSVWTNDATNVGTANRPNRPVVLPCVTGLYSVRLGDQSLPHMKLVPVGAFSSENRALRIWFNDGTNGVHQLTPDHVLTSGPYAMRAPSSGVPNTIVFTSSGVWTKPIGLKYVEVEVVGGGGGGGGTTNSYWGGGGGGGGGYSKKTMGASALGSTETVTVGVGGSSGPSGGGGVGGDSIFGIHAVATGGTGGSSGNGFETNGGGVGGSATGGDINISGSSGGSGVGPSSGSGVSVGGNGGSSVLGMGAGITTAIGLSEAYDGSPGTGYGGGGSGCANAGPSPDSPGGAGAPGVVIVKEYF